MELMMSRTTQLRRATAVAGAMLAVVTEVELAALGQFVEHCRADARRRAPTRQPASAAPRKTAW
jgi:hypothetical protein